MDVLVPALVMTSLDAITKEEAIKKLSSLLLKEGRITDLTLFIENVLQRENEFSTGFGEGFAIPHGKSPVVLTPSVVVAKLDQGIEWNSLDGQPVHMIFLLAIPLKDAGTTHLKIMASLAEHLMDDDILEKLGKIENSEELYHYVKTLLGGK